MHYSYAKERCEMMAEYMIEYEATVRQCALHFSVSKSTVHKDITSKLYYINRKLYDEVKKILERNKSERHLRGGEATRQKYIRQKQRNGENMPKDTAPTATQNQE